VQVLLEVHGRHHGGAPDRDGQLHVEQVAGEGLVIELVLLPAERVTGDATLTS
jgi:hypothetical protein